MNTEIFRLLGLILVACVFAVVLRQGRGEYAMLLCIATVTVVLMVIFKNVYPPILELKEGFEKSGVSIQCFSVVLKSLGISYVTGFVADICRDNGQTSLAGKAELAGKCAILILCLPLMNSVLDTALGFAGI